MFDSIVYKNSIGPGPLIDIGTLAESLLFYERVAVIGNTGTIKDLLARIPPFIVLSLMREGRLEIHYLADQTGVSTTEMSNGRSIHSLVRFSSPDHTIEQIGPQTFKDAAGGTTQAKLGAKQFTNLLRSLDHSKFDQASVLQAITDNLATEASVQALVRKISPSFNYTNKNYFRIEREEDGFYVDTNIDFTRLNALYHQTVPPQHSSLTEAYFLALIQGAYEATYFAGELNSEVAVHPMEQVVQAGAVDAVVRRHKRSESQIGNFVELTLADGRKIREAVNSGVVTFAAVVKLLKSADKFRHWLKQQPVDANLLRSYYQETIKDSWADRLPTKSVRWSIFTGLGLAADSLGAGGLGTATGVAISAVDSFLLDKLFRGWKPHQFVESDLVSLFDPNNTRIARR
ncbi:hypothetical protein Nit79A3_0190 [Nitrosomonas sp. Is79A3]|uniref:hypothetical protein n=1 Tax=Nitrosomonas sp. (strain Is79A3) TaxID=261292 RepID=UPI000215D081